MALCNIPGNPDIYGIGVRIAIYIQNLLCFLPALWALWDGEVTQDELDSAETQTTTNLVLAFAILISSIVQALTLGLSNFHANIVLSMSWMNNTNAFVYFLLYIQHKRKTVKPTWAAWHTHVREKLEFLIPRHGKPMLISLSFTSQCKARDRSFEWRGCTRWSSPRKYRGLQCSHR
ncbi:hypothetical protein BKA70DRAFT_763918 [Coprinopsis sp. MPI-PUGE-AT-0042]|nr:hypothetical protein BKA70DRAFT_763918 [Coprinopsis sp. MPI-PUGE-AT-0042]